MAYQFFAKHHQSRNHTSHPLSPPRTAYHNRQNIPPSHPPPRPPIQPSTSETPKSKPPATDPTFQPGPYPLPIAPGYPTPHPHITIDPVSTAHIPSLTRITGLLLPIRYPNSFYTATITDPVISSLSRVAVYHDHPVSTVTPSASLPVSANMGTDKVIGGIRCRLERLPATTTGLLNFQSKSQQEPANLYIQTLHLLSPYRGRGVAASLLNALLTSSQSRLDSKDGGDYQVSDLVKHYNIRTVTAHVHEANDEALQWYVSRGFKVEDEVVENYYRRLKPSGARIVKLTLDWSDRELGDAYPPNDQGNVAKSEEDKNQTEDDDWEKVEPEEADEHDHGVQSVSDSRILENDDAVRKKRKTDSD